MKSFLIKVFGAIFSVFMFTSCLGDDDNYIEVAEDFAYIKYDEKDGKYAVTQKGGIILADQIDVLLTGRAYYVSYKATYDGSGLGRAERFDLIERDPLPEAKFKVGEPYLSNVPSYLLADSIHPINVAIGACHPYSSYYDDKWEVQYTLSKKEDDKIDVYYYYDPNAQKINGVDLDENEIVIDIRFVHSEKSVDPEEPKTERLSALGSLKDLRDQYPAVFPDGEDVADVGIVFRYVREVDKRPVVTYIGSFSINEGHFYMVFSQDKGDY